MRLGKVVLMLSLLAGAPAFAEESVNLLRWLGTAAEKPAEKTPATKPAAKKPTTAKIAHTKLPTLAPKAADAKLTDAKPAQDTAEEATPVEAKPAEAKPVVTKPAAKKAGQTKPAVVKPAEAQPAEAKSADTKPAEPKPAESKPATVKAAASKTATAKAEPAKPEAAKSEPAKVKPALNAFAGIPAAERGKVQAALLWSGDYTGPVNGEDAMLAAIKNYQKRHKSKVTGVLTGDERANLLAAARDHEQEFGWSVVVDPATGIRIGLPTKMVPNAREAARGTSWSSAHGDVQVETFRITDPDLKLPALFEQLKKEPATRKVEYSVLRDDNFFISGLQGLKKFSVKAQIRNGEVRGFTMLYDQMMETIVAPVMVAMSSAFSPFPEHSAPFAALAKSVEYGNGLVVSAQGHIVTDRKLTEGCQVIVAAGLGDAVRVADDKDNGLALLRVYGPRQLSPLALPQDAAKSGELTLIGIPDPKEENGGRKLTEIKAKLVDGAAIELRQPVPMAGFSGAAALDSQGRFLGMMQMRNAVLASVEPAAPPVRLVSAETIRGFLSRNNVAAAPAGDDAKASVVRMICVRK
jgi:hypothetical protein